jgi:hypothetical protein
LSRVEAFSTVLQEQLEHGAFGFRILSTVLDDAAVERLYLDIGVCFSFAFRLVTVFSTYATVDLVNKVNKVCVPEQDILRNLHDRIPARSIPVFSCHRRRRRVRRRNLGTPEHPLPAGFL